MPNSDKDTIYIDIDDEITAIIDKLQASDGKIVALVLPKRASVFQSIVNMKLLKRAADGADKHLVLITSEAGLLPLAGAAGVHVAKSLTSKPEIPQGPGLPDENDEAEAEEATEEELNPEKSVGELAADSGQEVETLELDDEEPAPEATGDDLPKKDKKSKKDKKLAVPNFERFRLWLILGGLGFILLIIGLVFANSAFQKATINIKTDATNINTNSSLILSTTAKSLDASTNTLPTKAATTSKTYSQQVPTTGQKNTGNKASGDVSITNCSDGTVSVPAGTGLKSSGGNTYITQNAVDVPASNFKSNGQCKSDGKATVSIMAQAGGTAYNLPSGSNMSVAYQSSILSATSGNISGGTDNIVRSVNQNDINAAKAKIQADNNDTVKQTLSDQLTKDNYFAIGATFQTGTPNVSNSNNVGDVADNVTVTETITYSLFGVPKNDITKVVENDIKSQIDSHKQSILDNGLDKATFNVDNISPTGAQLTMSGTASVGPDLDKDSIAKAAAGKKPGAIKADLGSNPDVVSVDIKLSPFWVSNVPKNPAKIKVNIAKPTTTKAANGSH